MLSLTLRPVVAVDRIFSDEESVRRLIGRFPDLGLLRVCYEAGPTGFWLARLLRSMGVSCQVGGAVADSSVAG
jgi:transposase